MSNIHDITDYRGEAKQERIQSICDSQKHDGTVVFLDTNPYNLDPTDDIQLLKQLSKHFKFSHQHHLQVVYTCYIMTPDGVITSTEEICQVNANNI